STTMARRPQDCSYRRRARRVVEGEVADCLLLEALTGADVTGLHAVRGDACAACCGASPPGDDRLNPVVASLLYDIAARNLAADGVPGWDRARAAWLKACAESELALTWVPPPGTAACDVVLCCDRSSADADRAIRSVLDQRDAHAFLHLVDDGGGGSEVVRRY